MRSFLLALSVLACGGAASPTWGQADASPAPAASPPPPMDCMPGPYIIFFGLGSDRVSASARPILDDAIAGQDCSWEGNVAVIGHADRSGPAARNLALSRRRAIAAATYLATHGMEAGTIVIEGVGESDLLVETSDGVLEPQNRYVAVLLGVPSELTGRMERISVTARDRIFVTPVP
jgi:outer membrane protein OmpA-like peptidoglycan-associated protein